MSRTYNQHHPSSHNSNNRKPVPFLDDEGTITRKRKIKPYGLKGNKGNHEGQYFKKWGDVATDIVDKKKARKDWKKERKQLFEEYEND